MFSGKMLLFVSVLMFLVYGAALYYLDLSYASYIVLHLIIALVLVFTLKKIVGTQESSASFGLKLSVIVGVLLLALNYFMMKFSERLPDVPYLHSIPNPIIYFVLFLVMFNIPFLLYSTFSVGKTFMISLVIILIVLAIPIVYATVTLGCPGISCNLGGCFCKYSIVSESCDCASICSAEGKSAVDAASSVNVFPDFKSLLSRNNLNCNCFCK